MGAWTDKIEKAGFAESFALAPDWYILAKKEGATKERLFEMVKGYCEEVFAKEAQKNDEEIGEVDSAFVELMIAAYET